MRCAGARFKFAVVRAEFLLAATGLKAFVTGTCGFLEIEAALAKRGDRPTWHLLINAAGLFSAAYRPNVCEITISILPLPFIQTAYAVHFYHR